MSAKKGSFDWISKILSFGTFGRVRGLLVAYATATRCHTWRVLMTEADVSR